MGFGFGKDGCGKGGFDESIIIWILVIFLLLGDDGFGDFGKGCRGGFGKGDDSFILIIIVLLLVFSGGHGFLGLGTEAE